MKIVDANFILRYLLNDIEEQAKEAYWVISSNLIYLPNEVIAEVVYVLERIYKVDRVRICSEVKDFIESANVQLDNVDILRCALDIFLKYRVDFVDSLLCAYAKIADAKIYTFDKKLLNVIKRK